MHYARTRGRPSNFRTGPLLAARLRLDVRCTMGSNLVQRRGGGVPHASGGRVFVTMGGGRGRKKCRGDSIGVPPMDFPQWLNLSR